MVMPFITLKGIGRLPFSLVIFMLAMGLLVGADLIFAELATQFRIILLIYIALLVYTRTEPAFRDTVRTPLGIGPAIPAFFITFIATFIGTMLIASFGAAELIAASTLESAVQLTFAIGSGITLALVKSYIEEEVFRARMTARLGFIGQAVLFGVFHISIITLTLMSLGRPFTFFSILMPVLWLTGLGVFWYYIYQRWGLPGATGSHFGYNMVALGLAPVIFGGIIV